MKFPPRRTMASRLVTTLRYGENPHQEAALYVPEGPHAMGLPQAEQLQGKELSYNNYNDANAALELAAEFAGGPPTVVIVKHANPCGVAAADAGSKHGTRRWPAIRCPRSAGSSRSTARSTAPTAEAICADLYRGRRRPRRGRGGAQHFAKKKNLRLLIGRRCPIRAAAGVASDHRRRAAGAGPRQRACRPTISRW